MAKRCTFEWHA